MSAILIIIHNHEQTQNKNDMTRDGKKKSTNAIMVSGHRLNSTKLVSFNLVSVATTAAATTATHQFYPLHRHLRDSRMKALLHAI